MVEQLTIKQITALELTKVLIAEGVQNPATTAIIYTEQILNCDKPKIGFAK